MRQLRTAAVLAAAVLLGGCSGGGSDGGSGDGAADPSTAGAGATTTLARTVTGAVDLRRLVVSKAPVGYDLLASPPFGAVTLQRLLDEFSDAPAEDRIILEETRFKSGYTRGWLRGEPRSFLGIFVFDFVDQEGARSARDRFAAQTESKKSASRFVVEGIADAVGESYTEQTEGEAPERVHVITFVRG
ncbi:MAG TPA: hypothetical protein VM942_10435, partial [Acidimicrobiales bacterium]|nr:hypothetical protein [Acidimicrobiales bacterium]